jgi:HEAT repeat protein
MLGDILAAMGLPEPRVGLLSEATALLRLHPEYAADLEHLFEAKGTNLVGRALVLDLLASAGTPEAQAAMRAALASPSARVDGKFATLLQRFSFVQRPTSESTGFVENLYEHGGSRDERFAAAHSLGSLAGHLAKSDKDEDRAAARRETSRLARDLDAAKAPKDKKALLGALGNAGSHDFLATVARYKGDPDVDVRVTAALALRKDPSPESRATLLSMMQDKDGEVAGASLEALGYQTVSRDSVRAIAAAVTGHKTTPEADTKMVTFFADHLDAPETRGALETMLARVPEGDYREAQRIRSVIAQLPATRK